MYNGVCLIGQFVVVLCMLHVNSRGGGRRGAVHTCRAWTQAYPLSQYDRKVPGKPLIIGMYGMCFGERVIYHIIMNISLDHTVHVCSYVCNQLHTYTHQVRMETGNFEFVLFCLVSLHMEDRLRQVFGGV